jgi:hypothetical protein
MATPNPCPSNHVATTLHHSPFFILGATPRDDRRKLVKLAEEKSLELTSDVCQNARSDLLNPRKRLSAEMAWLPGVSPAQTRELLGFLEDTPARLFDQTELPSLARLNLLTAAFEKVLETVRVEPLGKFILKIAEIADDLNPEEVLREINEDRIASGFPEIHSLEQIEVELKECRRRYCKLIKKTLDRLPTMTLLGAMSFVTDKATSSGDSQAFCLIDDLVDGYEVEAQEALLKESENIHRLVRAIRNYASAGNAAMKPYLEQLDSELYIWERIAEPILLSLKGRGINHVMSVRLSNEIRGLALELNNYRNMEPVSKRLIELLQAHFSKIPEIKERSDADARTFNVIR